MPQHALQRRKVTMTNDSHVRQISDLLAELAGQAGTIAWIPAKDPTGVRGWLLVSAPPAEMDTDDHPEAIRVLIPGAISSKHNKS